MGLPSGSLDTLISRTPLDTLCMDKQSDTEKRDLQNVGKVKTIEERDTNADYFLMVLLTLIFYGTIRN